MKNLGRKKLPLSLKTASGKQQKISNFFIPSKATNFNEGEKKEDIKVQDQCSGSGLLDRLPGETLCSQCLKKSPIPNSGFCSQCNLVESSSPVASSSWKELKSQPIDCNPRVNTFNSPEIIPATPPVKGKQKSNVKLAKRKCSFENEFQLKKKYSATLLEHHEEFIPQKSNEFEKKSFKENCLGDTGKLVLQCKKTRNPSNKPTIDSVNKTTKNLYCNSILSSNDCVENGKIIPGLPYRGLVQTSSGIPNPNNDIIRALEQNFESKSSFLDKSERTDVVPELDQNPKSNSNCNEITIDKVVENVPILAQSTVYKSNNQDKVFAEEIEHISNHQNITNLENEIDNESVVCDATANNHNSIHGELSCSNCLDSFSKSADVVPVPTSLDHLNTGDAEENQTVEEVLFDDSSFLEDLFKEHLRLDSNTRCKVMSVEYLKECGEVVLSLRSYDAGETEAATCVLRGSWANCNITVGDLVNVTARPVMGQEGCWVVDNEFGLVVTHPDTLVSGTTVVGSLFCMRRSVLSDMYRGIDTDSPIMVIGSFLHQLLQEVLKKKVSTLEGIKQVLNEFTKTRYFVFNLYSSGMLLEKTMETLNEFVPKIHAFVRKYLSPESTHVETWNEKNSWNGTITNIADIEENIWSPSLGLKGKIDVTVKTSAKNFREKVMPLELKTGRASFSAEHRGQVILYTMMMSELGKTVDSGLLLYLREGVMQEVPVGAVERRDLMLLRNQLVTQLKASHHIVADKIGAPVLPPPIHHHSACARCPYLTLCSAALRVNGCDGVSEENPLRQLTESSTSHLQLHLIVYVFHWSGLLRLEHTEAILNSPALHHIWTKPPADRAKRGTCIPKVRLVDRVMEVVAGSYQHIFQYDGDSVGGLSEGDYVIVSSASRPAIAAGFLTQLSQSHITLLLERDLSIHQVAENVWYLDKYESQSGLAFNMTNLGCLLDNTDQANRLRKAVIDVELPDFSPKLSSRVLKASLDLLSELNDQQRKAIFRAFAADHYILIKGMPGTGKTATIVALVQLAVRLGRSVLITSHTHSAVDNVLLRLRNKVDFLRLGSVHKLHPELAQYGEAGHEFKSPNDMHTFYTSKSVVGVTCLGSSHPLLARRQFDLCIVDEATQVLQPTVLRPLFSAHKFILIGDPNQLPPLVRSAKAKELGLGESLFARLDRPAVTTELSLQYRMNQTITDLANCLTYGGKLTCGNPKVASATLTLCSTVLEGEPAWMGLVLNQSLAQAVVAVDTGVCEAVACVNVREAFIVLQILAALAKSIPDEKVGVIAPYRAQVDYLRQQVKSCHPLVEVNTVDQYQGRDKDVIIYSCTRSAKPVEFDILGDKNRLTVAITRARHKLIIIGNVTLLRGYTVFDQLFNSLSSSCIVSIS